jgi:hypothetical protein
MKALKILSKVYLFGGLWLKSIVVNLPEKICNKLDQKTIFQISLAFLKFRAKYLALKASA